MKSPDLFPAHWDLPSAIGQLFLSFGALEYFVLTYLERHLPPREFQEMKSKPFDQRLKRVALHFGSQNASPGNIVAFNQLVAQLDPIRDLRNQIAHAYIFAQQDPVGGIKICLFQVNDLDAEHHPDSQPVQFEDLKNAIEKLPGLIEEFKLLTGWQTTAVY